MSDGFDTLAGARGSTTESRRAPTQFPYGHLTADAGASADPVLVEIVQGSLAERRDGGRDRDRSDQPQPDDPRRP